MAAFFRDHRDTEGDLMAKRTSVVTVRLTAKRCRKLKQIVAAATSPQRLVLRAKIIMLAAGGTPNPQIARVLGCSITVARMWRGRFAVPGIPGLFDRPRSGRPEVHGPSARLAVLAVATSVPPLQRHPQPKPVAVLAEAA
jgi:hypothetical protein